jgi:hypothetical protein
VAGLALIAVLVTTAISGPAQRTEQPIDVPSPEPTPTLTERPEHYIYPAQGTDVLSPRQTVLSYNASLVTATTSLDDADVRLSVWEAVCQICPPRWGGRGQPWYDAMAVTDDGFETATYLPPPWSRIIESITSVGRDTFLIDESNGDLKLLEADGTLRRVRLVEETRTASDPRLVVRCGGFEAGYGDGWCVLDLPTATVAPLSSTYMTNGTSDGDPTLAQRPWGIESRPDLPDRAWWDDGGTRRYADLPTTGRVQSVPSLSRGADTPTYVHWRLWSHQIDVYAVTDRTNGLARVGSRPWLPVSRDDVEEVGHPHDVALGVDYAETPDGGLLAWSSRVNTREPRLTIWRADSLADGEFAVVYRSDVESHDTFDLGLHPVLHDGRIHLDRLVSDDDGRSWTEQAGSWR